ncbi:MAG: hypothetical protein OEU36_11210 [Gammaproteobacteria bacterium]|nr:hypothetical protein [Gammaproteobacteria bacterium]
MNVKRFFTLSLIMGSLLIPHVSSACSAAGPSTHVGKVVTIDAAAKSFTILDAETLSPIRFFATDDILTQIRDSEGTAFVDFEKRSDDTLAATNVVFK